MLESARLQLEVHLTDALYNLPTPVKRLFEALHRGDLAGGEPRETIPTSQRRLKRLSPADVDQLVREYCDGQGSIYELADRWGVHRNTIAKYLKSRGLELGRLSLTNDEVRRAQRLRDDGLSFNAIGRDIWSRSEDGEGGTLSVSARALYLSIHRSITGQHGSPLQQELGTSHCSDGRGARL